MSQEDEQLELQKQILLDSGAYMDEDIESKKEKAKKMLELEGFEPTNADIDSLLEKDPESAPSFPIIIFAVAVAADILADIGDLSLILIPLVWVAKVVVWFILFLWRFGKGGSAGRIMLKYAFNPQKRLATILLSFIPFINFIPFEAIFVVLIHNKEKKLVELFFKASEMFTEYKNIK